MEATLFAVFAFVALLAIIGAIAAVVGDDTREGFAPYSAGA
jgi:hypothetical protein